MGWKKVVAAGTTEADGVISPGPCLVGLGCAGMTYTRQPCILTPPPKGETRTQRDAPPRDAWNSRSNILQRMKPQDQLHVFPSTSGLPTHSLYMQSVSAQ